MELLRHIASAHAALNQTSKLVPRERELMQIFARYSCLGIAKG